MTADGCAMFNNSCTGEDSQGQDTKISEMIVNYDSDGDGKLSFDDFK